MQAAVDITLQVLDMAIDARTAVAYLRRQAMTIFLTCRACFAHSPCIRFQARSFPLSILLALWTCDRVDQGLH